MAKKPSTRTSSAPLQVMLEPEKKARFERFASELGLSMRELVVHAIEHMMAETRKTKLPAEDVAVESALGGDHDAYVLLRDIHQPLAGDDGRPLPKSVDLALLARTVAKLLQRVNSLERQRR